MDTESDVIQALPALFSESGQDGENATVDPVQYAAQLASALQEKEDLIIDFTSLKTCLDPTSGCENQQKTVSL